MLDWVACLILGYGGIRFYTIEFLVGGESFVPKFRIWPGVYRGAIIGVNDMATSATTVSKITSLIIGAQEI